MEPQEILQSTEIMLEKLNGENWYKLMKLGVKMSKIKKELKEFLEYKKDYKFVQKELIVKDECIYCEDILLKDIERK